MVQLNRKAHWDGKPRTATSTDFDTAPLNSSEYLNGSTSSLSPARTGFDDISKALPVGLILVKRQDGLGVSLAAK